MPGELLHDELRWRLVTAHGGKVNVPHRPRRAKLAARVDEIAASERLGAKMRIVAGVHDARALAGALRAAAR